MRMEHERPNPMEEKQRFESRALAFKKDYSRGVGFEVVKLHGRSLHIGTGEHRGLVIGKADTVLLQQVLELLKRFFKRESVTPKNYILKELRCAFGVQEFLEQPTLQDLIFFLKGEKNQIYLQQISEYYKKLCEKFLKDPKNEGVTLEKLDVAERELYEHSTALEKYGRRTIFADRNVLVLGQEKDGKVIVAPVDVE